MVQVEEAPPPPDTTTLDGAHDAVRAVPTGRDPVIFTIPAKPPRLVRVTLTVPDPPARIIMEGWAETLKSTTLRVTEAVCVSGPLIAITVTM